jgi:hypothetical protein
MIRPPILYVILFLSLGLVVTYVSGTVLTEYQNTAGGLAIMNYGFPLPWMMVSGTLCGYNPLQSSEAYLISNAPCFKSCCATTYNLAFLFSDVLFYMGIGYLPLFGYRRLMRGIDRRARERINDQPIQPED